MAGGFRLSRRSLLASAAAAAGSLVRPLDAALPAPDYRTDFIQFQRALELRYAHWDAERRTAWTRQLVRWKLRARVAATPAELGSLLQAAVDVLHDDAVTVANHAAHPVRRIPLDTDVWPVFERAVAMVAAVRPSGDADVAGLRPGHVIENVQGVPVARAVEAMAGRGALERDREWALRRLMAGPWAGTFHVDVRESDKRRRLHIERTPPMHAPRTIDGRRMGEARDLGYIRLVDVDRDARDFDAALDGIRGTRALILDLRDPANGIVRESARAMLGRFLKVRSRWLTSVAVDPRGTLYEAPVVALVDRWTAGEAEAFAAGLVSLAAGRIVGTATAGQAAEIAELQLPRSGIEVRFPERDLRLADGRWLAALEPSVRVDLTAPSGGPGDPILYQALKLLG